MVYPFLTVTLEYLDSYRHFKTFYRLISNSYRSSPYGSHSDAFHILIKLFHQPHYMLCKFGCMVVRHLNNLFSYLTAFYWLLPILLVHLSRHQRVSRNAKTLHYWCKVATTVFHVFGMTQAGIETSTSCTRGGIIHAFHYFLFISIDDRLLQQTFGT